MMLLFDMMTIGNRLLAARKRLGMTQAEVAERAGLSDRTYADIERGGVNMRIETFLRICQTLSVSPDDILTEERASTALQQEELLRQLDRCSPAQQKTALRLLEVYLHSLGGSETPLLREAARGILRGHDTIFAGKEGAG